MKVEAGRSTDLMTMWIRLAATPATLALLASPLPIAAQQTSPPSASSPGQLAKAVCLSRKSDAPGNNEVVIAVPPNQQGAMEARGYAAHACKSDPGAMATYRAKMCEFAQKAPQSLKDQFARNNKSSPQELCDMAGQVSD